MTVLKIVSLLAIFIGLIVGLSALQAYSERKYSFPIFNLVSFSLLVLGWLLICLGIYLLPEPRSVAFLVTAVTSLTFPDDISNSVALVWLAALPVLLVFGLTTKATNILFAVVAVFVQGIAALLIVPFLFLLIPGGKKRRRRRTVPH